MLKLAEMEAIAKDATKDALRPYAMSEEQRALLTLGKDINATEGVFELYIPGARAADAKMVTRAVVDRVTGKVEVKVFL